MKQIDQIELLNQKTGLSWRVSDDTGGMIASGEFFTHWLDEISQVNKDIDSTFSYSWSDLFDIYDHKFAVTIDQASELVNKIEHYETNL